MPSPYSMGLLAAFVVEQRRATLSLNIFIKKYPLANQIGISAVAQGNTGHLHAGLQAFLDYLGLERVGIRGSLAHGNLTTRVMVSAYFQVENIALIAGIG